MRQLEKSSIEELCHILKEATGVLIRPEKYFLMENRINRRLHILNLPNYSSYLEYLKGHSDELEAFISLMTTHKTSFFREFEHFGLLEKWILKYRPKDLRLVSAACSTGEEVYSLIAYLESLQKKHSFSYRVLGFDICQESLNHAQKGVYKNGAEIIKELGFSSYFKLLGKDSVQIHEDLKEKAIFRKKNLIRLELPKEFKADIIFLRNVLIYFDKNEIDQVIGEMKKILNVNGKLFVGMSEHLSDEDGLLAIGNSVYERCA